jgi:osmoprotectant transport system substrate-binding protein
MRFSRMLALGAVSALLVSACSLGGGGSKGTIKIGSVGFSEAKLIAEIYAQALEANGYTVDRTGIGLGDRSVVAPAIESGQIDLQPEYIGSRVKFYGGTATGDSATNFAALQPLASAKGLTVLNYTPAIDTNAFVVRPETAAQYHLATLSDAAAIQTELKWGLATDCPTNALCGAPGGALSQYGITTETIAGATLLSACDTPMADALKNQTIDVGELCSTQADIAANEWVTLQDDKKTQPADNISPIVRNDFLAKVDAASFEKILNDVSAKIETTTLTDLNNQLAGPTHPDIKDVAKDWLKANGFVK